MGVIGGSYNDFVDTTAKQALGTCKQFIDDNGYSVECIYLEVNDAGGVVAGAPVQIAAGYTAISTVSEYADAVAPQAFSDNEYGWFQLRGILAGCQVASTVAAGEYVSRILDSNGDFVEVSDVDESGTATHADGTLAPRGRALTSHSAGTATILLF
jgi:hypothetical protein